MEMIQCFACEHKIHSSAKICPSCGAALTPHNKFNWLAFIFTSLYYGGKDSQKKAYLLSALYLIPFSPLFIMVYSGLKANKDIKPSSTFKWSLVLPQILVLSVATGIKHEFFDKAKSVPKVQQSLPEPEK